MIHIDDGLFGGMIHFRDIILGPFARNLQAFEIQAGAIDDGAGATSRLDGGIEHRVHKIPYLAKTITAWDSRKASRSRHYKPLILND
jgi:hypothetical protein